MDDPDVILRIDRHADRVAQDPMVRQRLRPQRIDFKPRRLHAGGLRHRAVLQHLLADGQRGEHYQERHANIHIAFSFMCSPPRQGFIFEPKDFGLWGVLYAQICGEGGSLRQILTFPKQVRDSVPDQ